jgi:hypothetical protein
MLSIRDRQRYRDIEWLMPSMDVVDVLERLGAERISVHGNQVQCLCPDHEMFVNRISSHPNWICNADTGETYCRTEPRGSNLVWTVRRVLDCTIKEAVKFMTGTDASRLQSAAMLGKIRRLRKGRTEDKRDPVRLDDMKEDLKNRYISDACYQFFIHPPNKKPTNINRETVDRYRVFERRWGYYSNRTVIPFFMNEKLVGFCAIDLLGKRQWLLEHPVNDEDDYRKVLYPLNFRAKECLFGYDDVETGCEHLFVTEGAREVMKIWQEYTTNAVGCLKAELSDEQILLITKKAPKEVVLCFDGDEAGWAATDKNADKLLRTCRVRKCYLPVGMDPKNLGRNDIEKLIKRSKLA